ncbi:MAG TPA: hypothetical protein VID26_04235 [Candidatus Limnocylindrales bacterium]
MARSRGRWAPTRLRPGADRRLLLVVASFGVSVVPAEEPAVPSF